MSTIQTTATFPNIPAEKLAEFKELAEQAYASSDAVLAHVANLGDLFERIIEVGGDMEVEGFGTPSAELLAMTAAMNATVYAPFQSK